MVTTDVDMKLSFSPGMALVGDINNTDVTGKNVRVAGGAIADTSTDLFAGAGRFAFELGRDSELRFPASEGNHVTGGKLSRLSPGGCRMPCKPALWHSLARV
jgi:hypothetical protein